MHGDLTLQWKAKQDLCYFYASECCEISEMWMGFSHNLPYLCIPVAYSFLWWVVFIVQKAFGLCNWREQVVVACFDLTGKYEWHIQKGTSLYLDKVSYWEE